SFMFESYANRVEADVPISDKLPADKLRKAFRQRYQIIIPPRSVKTIKPPKTGYDKLTMKGDKKLLEYTLKIGCTEASVLLAQLDKLPRALVPEVKVIRREFSNSTDYEIFLGGFSKLGMYGQGTIILYSPEEIAFSEFNNVQSQILCDTLQHELGHAIWENLDTRLVKEWRRLSKAGNKRLTKKQKSADFIADFDLLKQVYLDFGPLQDAVNDPETGQPPELDMFLRFKEEEFCETFAAYVNHGTEFREMASRSDVLRKKYDFFKRLFSEHSSADESPEYFDKPVASIKDAFGYKRSLVKARSQQTALMLMTQEYKCREDKSRENRMHKVKSYEAHEEEQEQETYDGHDAGVEELLGEEDEMYSDMYRLLQDILPVDEHITIHDAETVYNLLEDSAEEAADYLDQNHEIHDRDDLEEMLDAFRADKILGRDKC
ncbi:hypothetical protein KY363_02295, partial [Candidatus Woesearchaeota archaeon]|nr:hypothetical protein [Candidatus Woesearchaeota archaeon]